MKTETILFSLTCLALFATVVASVLLNAPALGLLALPLTLLCVGGIFAASSPRLYWRGREVTNPLGRMLIGTVIFLQGILSIFATIAAVLAVVFAPLIFILQVMLMMLAPFILILQLMLMIVILPFVVVADFFLKALGRRGFLTNTAREFSYRVSIDGFKRR
jgi:hypothetical protein